MSDEGVCRTAPATPGLLNILLAVLKQRAITAAYFNFPNPGVPDF